MTIVDSALRNGQDEAAMWHVGPPPFCDTGTLVRVEKKERRYS
jgi:hypothetical protein